MEVTKNTQANDTQAIEDMKQKFAVMQNLSREFADVSWGTRFKRLSKLERMVNENRDAIAKAISQDFGHRSESETLMLEIVPTLEGIRHAKKHGKEWMRATRVQTGKWFLPASSYVQKQPLGVVGIISPWNYPLYLATGPLTAALVAGNRAMLKVSEYSPNFGKWLSETLPKYFSEDEVYLADGGLEAAQAFSSMPFDHLLFTGSTSVGKHIMRAAADNLTPVTLELGGKSPVIITDKSSIERAVNRILSGKLVNAGQTCIAPDYVLLPAGLETLFVDIAKNWVAKHYPNIENNKDYTFVVNHRQYKRLEGYLDEAEKTNANLAYLADANLNPETGFIPPVVASNLQEGTQLLTDEIFGPILPLVTYESLDEAIAYVNARPRPLALYVFGDSDKKINKVMNSTVSGGVSINDTIYHIAQANLPFGGVGDSGMGNYHGKYGFDTFTHEKAVFKQSKVNFMDMLQAPYGKKFDNLMKVATKW